MSTHTLVGFGTLLDLASVATTIGDSAGAKTYIPVMIEGYQRLFNLAPSHYRSSDMVKADGLEIAAANTRPRSDCSLNGVAFEVTAKEYHQLRLRERFYDIEEVEVLCFESRKPLGVAMINTAADNSPWVRSAPLGMRPKWNDIRLAWLGSYRISKAFGDVYASTTYMQDGVTLVADAYAAQIARFAKEADPNWGDMP